jgi:hypothetical protein
MRTPNCSWRIGKVEVKTKGVAREVVVGSTATPCTLNVENPGVRSNLGPTMLFTLA